MEGPGRPSPPPPPLHGTNESKKGKKRQRDPPAASARLQNPTSSAPQLPRQQQREVSIIHDDEPPVYQAANPQEFTELVQRHTGMSPGPARAKEVPTAPSTAPKAVQSSADGSHAASEMIRLEDIPELAFKIPTPTTLPQISPQECLFPDSYNKAAFRGISGQFPPSFPLQIAPQDRFFSGSNRNAVLKGNSGQLPRLLQPQLPPHMRQIAPVTPAPNIAYHSSTANHSLLPITAQYRSSQQIQGPSSVPSNSSFSPINERSNLPQGLSVPYRSTTISPEIQQTSVPDKLPRTADEVDQLLAILKQTQGPPNELPNSSLSPINEPQGVRVPHTSTTAQTYNSSPQIQQTSAMLAFERKEPFPRLPPP